LKHLEQLNEPGRVVRARTTTLTGVFTPDAFINALAFERFGEFGYALYLRQSGIVGGRDLVGRCSLTGATPDAERL
jgi:hypothetical protein